MTNPSSLRWWQPTPERFLGGLIAAQGFLYLSEQYNWFWFNERLAWTMLVNLLVVTAGLLLLALTYLGSVLLRRGFQFSIRTLLLLIATVGIACGWYRAEVERAKGINRLVNEGVTAVKTRKTCSSLGDYDSQLPKNGFSDLLLGGRSSYDPFGFPVVREPSRLERAIRWIDQTLGADSFRQIEDIEGAGNDQLHRVITHSGRTLRSVWLYDFISTETVRRLSSCPNLRFVFIEAEVVTNELLASIGNIRQLEGLSISGKSETPIQIGPLRKLPDLKLLALGEFPVEPTGIDFLKQLRRMNDLTFANTNFPSSGLQHLQDLSELSWLTMTKVGLNDDYLECLPPSIRSLELSKNPISDQGLAKLIHLKQLRSLALSETKITDRGIVYLRELSQLAEIELNGTRVGIDMTPWREMVSIRSLSLRDSMVNDESLHALSSRGALEYLYLDGCAISENGLKLVPWVGHLSIDRTNVTPEGRKALERNHRILSTSAADPLLSPSTDDPFGLPVTKPKRNDFDPFK